MLNKTTLKIKQITFLFLIKKALDTKSGRKVILDQFDKKLYKAIVERGSERHLKEVQIKKYQWTKALIKSGLKKYEKGYISSNIIIKLLVLMRIMDQMIIVI